MTTNSSRRRRPAVALGVAVLVMGLVPLLGANRPALALNETAPQAGGSMPLSVLTRVIVNGSDRMTSVSTSEWRQFPVESTFAYIPRRGGSGLVALNRFYNGTVRDHRDCTCSVLPGYQLEFTLGYLWTSPTVAGIDKIIIGHSGTDYATYTAGDRPPGFADDVVAGYGYPRAGLSNPVLVSLSDGDTTVASNVAAGGAIWQWTQGGINYVNTDDYGREIQSSLNFDENSSSNGFFPKKANPTQAGDSLRHGAVTTLTADPSDSTQSTRAVPLEWVASNWGGSGDVPVAWPQLQVGKDLSLITIPGAGVAAQYDTVVTAGSPILTWRSSNPLNSTTVPPVLEAPAVYLGPQFTSLWTEEPGGASAQPTSVSPGRNTPGHYRVSAPRYFQSGQGGVIVSTPDLSHAFGLYAIDRFHGGSTEELDVVSAPNSNTTLIDAWVSAPSIPAGTSRWTTWMMSGSLASVVAMMDALHGAHPVT